MCTVTAMHFDQRVHLALRPIGQRKHSTAVFDWWISNRAAWVQESALGET